MAFNEEQKAFLQELLDNLKTELLDAVKTGDQGVAANITKKLKTINSDIESIKAKTVEPDDTEGDDAKSEGDDKNGSNRLVKALQQQLNEMQTQLEARNEAEKVSAMKSKIRGVIANNPSVNPIVIDDLLDLYYTRYQGNIEDQEGYLLIGEQPIDKHLSEYLSTPQGNVYTVKKETTGIGGKSSTSTNNNGKPKTFEEMVADFK